MPTEKQIMANRENALLSTGPKTTEGKKISSLNALKHGLLTTNTLFSNDGDETLEDFANAFWDDLQPQGQIETILVERIIASAWKLRCCSQIEVGLFHTKPTTGYDILAHRPTSPQELLAQNFGWGKENFANLHRYESGIERTFHKALHELQRLQAVRKGQNVLLPVAVDIDVSADIQRSD